MDKEFSEAEMESNAYVPNESAGTIHQAKQTIEIMQQENTHLLPQDGDDKVIMNNFVDEGDQPFDDLDQQYANGQYLDENGFLVDENGQPIAQDYYQEGVNFYGDENYLYGEEILYDQNYQLYDESQVFQD